MKQVEQGNFDIRLGISSENEIGSKFLDFIYEDSRYAAMEMAEGCPIRRIYHVIVEFIKEFVE
jgi:hypothetical protein